MKRFDLSEWLLRREVAKAKRVLLNWIAPDSVVEDKDHYVVGGRWTRSLLIFDKPSRAATGWSGWLAGLLLMDGGPDAHGTVRLSVTFTPFSGTGAGWKLGMAETGHQATLDLAASRGQVASRKVRNAVRDVDRVQQQLSDAATRLLAVCVVVTCEGPSRESCDAVWRQVTARLGARMLHWRPLTDRHALAFQQQTPGGDRKINHPLSWDTGTLAFSWPAIGNTVDMGTGPVWGQGVEDGKPIQYDPLDKAAGGPPAPHVCVIGPTGNGKSVAFFTVVAGYVTMTEGAPWVRIIDPKGDYATACERLGGLLIRLGGAGVMGGVALNCFDLAPVRWRQTERGPEPEKNVVTEGVQNVLGVVRLMCGASEAPLDPEMVAMGQSAALRTYKAAGIDWKDAATWDVGRADVPVLADLYRMLLVMGTEDEAPDACRKLAVLLKPYALELDADLFSRRTDADLENPFVVYDIRGIDKRLRPVVIHLIAANTWREVRRVSRRWIFGMDEVTQLLSYPESGRLVADVYLQGRFLGLSAWSMAQRIEHYLATQEGRDVLDSADTVLLLRQKDAGALRQAAARMNLSPGEATFLTSAGLGQGVLCTNGRGNACLNISAPQIVLDWLPKQVQADPIDAAATTA